MSEGSWTWQFRTPAKRTYDALDEHAQNRITDKLDEIVNDQWPDPDDYLEPVTGAPYSKLRIGQFRLGADCAHRRSSTCTLSNGVAVCTRPVTTDRPKRSVRYSSPGSPMISRRSGSSHRFRSIHPQNASESRAPPSSATSRSVPIRTRS